MSKSIRFIGTALFCWVAVRAVSLGLVPGTDALAFDVESSRRRPEIPPLQPSVLPWIEPADATQWRILPPQQALGQRAGPAYAHPGFQPYPIYIPVPANAATQSAPPRIVYLDAARAQPSEQPQPVAMASATQLPPVVPVATQSVPPLQETKPGFDRVSLSSWALMRNDFGPDSLSGNGTLGGSEAGARLMWRYDRRLAVTLRTSAPVNSQRGMEGAIGVRYQPFTSVPLAFTFERRRAFQAYGRNAFAMFAEGGVYGLPAPWQATLDGYFQAGIVDLNNPDWFVDGQMAVSRPVWRNISAGLGAWGGAQPGLYRFDAGPRLSVGLRKGVRAHADYRLNVAGNALPASGAALTLAADF